MCEFADTPAYDPDTLASLASFHDKYDIGQTPPAPAVEPTAYTIVEVSLDADGRMEHFMSRSQQFLELVDHESIRATQKHPKLNSHHEAYAVILEELDEYKTEVWKQTKARDPEAMRTELIQLAAMALRAAVDLGLMD